jgi:hypothetical protein
MDPRAGRVYVGHDLAEGNMDYVSDAGELVRRLRAFAFGGNAPAEIEDRLQSLPGVAADQLCDGAELLYAHYELLNDDGKNLVGQIYNYADAQGWSTFNKNGRSAEIVSLARRDLGEKGRGVALKSAKYPEPETMRRKDNVDWRGPQKESEAS